MSEDPIHALRKFNPHPGPSVGWSESDAGRASLDTVLSGDGELRRPIKDRKAHWAVAAAVIALVASSLLLTTRDEGSQERLEVGGVTETSTPSLLEVDPGPLASVGDDPYLLAQMGDRLLYWGDDRRAWVFDSSSNEWAPVDRAPWSPPSDSKTVWTGERLVILGGDDPDATRHSLLGTLFDPADGTWRSIAPSPIRSDTLAAAGWDGTDVLVWADAQHTEQGSPAAAAYGLASDEWRTLASAPPGDVQGQFDATGTADALVWVTAPTLPGATPGEPVLASYSSDADKWRVEAGTPQIQPSNGFLHTKIFKDLVVTAPSFPDRQTNTRRIAEWTVQRGWKVLDVAAGVGRCQVALGELQGLPVMAECGRVIGRSASGTWATITSDLPEGGVLPLSSSGFLVINAEEGRLWRYA